MNEDLEKKRELVQLLEERRLSGWERRRRRFLAAQARLFGVDDRGMPRADGIAQLLRRAHAHDVLVEKARVGDGVAIKTLKEAKPFSVDEYIVLNLGFAPGELRT
ncbi:MAG TPA: hypothetical protein VFA76_09375 [Terriglobales bacterium]|nr:hypothetical protein [Terriglobales bacterium]